MQVSVWYAPNQTLGDMRYGITTLRRDSFADPSNISSARAAMLFAAEMRCRHIQSTGWLALPLCAATFHNICEALPRDAAPCGARPCATHADDMIGIEHRVSDDAAALRGTPYCRQLMSTMDHHNGSVMRAWVLEHMRVYTRVDVSPRDVRAQHRRVRNVARRVCDELTADYNADRALSTALRSRCGLGKHDACSWLFNMRVEL